MESNRHQRDGRQNEHIGSQPEKVRRTLTNLWNIHDHIARDQRIHDALLGLSQRFNDRTHGLLRILQQFNSLPLEFEDMRSTPEY
ncbi:MAG: hypothetical protein B7Y28_23700 [Polaromonas sp. 16-63-31]|nr:MAG: hypothetical protein B7Y60_23620 [Polaromonas sp. 35-63-35]OYZ13494.1 MAG: hypothetical protein B7Y28_23700 [Polaromonas sp. 16-63-31]OZA45591.1 MAG: hypothetical protein B7X88_24435 [Polaromonas sp. 17-63-33]